MPDRQIVEREEEENARGILQQGRETENVEAIEWFRA